MYHKQNDALSSLLFCYTLSTSFIAGLIEYIQECFDEVYETWYLAFFANSVRPFWQDRQQNLAFNNFLGISTNEPFYWCTTGYSKRKFDTVRKKFTWILNNKPIQFNVTLCNCNAVILLFKKMCVEFFSGVFANCMNEPKKLNRNALFMIFCLSVCRFSVHTHTTIHVEQNVSGSGVFTFCTCYSSTLLNSSCWLFHEPIIKQKQWALHLPLLLGNKRIY